MTQQKAPNLHSRIIFDYPILEKILDQCVVILLGIFFLLLSPDLVSAAVAAEDSREKEKILKMSIDQLMQMEVTVTSVSKRPQKLHQTASAVFVITQEDIRRTGAVNLMEALRIAPGVQVSKINQNQYAISIRGFNRRLGSDKLLVLIDGRSIYSPADSGVFWLATDVVLEDVDRIEVIRGPGAALWGSNAVAGVINIITKSATETQGNMLAGGAGTEENGFVTFRHGGKTKNDFYYRGYAKYRDRDDGKLYDGTDSFDDKQMTQIGFRTDLQINPKDHLTTQGDYYYMNSDLDFKTRFTTVAQGNLPFKGGLIQKGANVLTRWTRTLDDTSQFKLQLYYDRFERDSGVPIDNVIQKTDLDFQYDFLHRNHNVSVGMNYQYNGYNYETTNIIRSEKESAHTGGFFIHDEITLVPETWNLILGSKFEYNEFSGFEVQPNIRTLWTPAPQHSLWGAISRAVRTPNTFEENATVQRDSNGAAFPIVIREVNDGQTEAEELVAYEVGYKFNLDSKFYFDVTGYYFDYDGLIDITSGASFNEASPSPLHLVIPFRNENAFKGKVYGLELSGQWQMLPNWRLSGGYSYNQVDLEKTKPNVTNTGDREAEGEPQHWLTLRSYLNLTPKVEFDTSYYYVSRHFSRAVPAYHRLDLRLGWHPLPNTEIALVGQNVTETTHSELIELLERDTLTQRSFYFKATFNF